MKVKGYRPAKKCQAYLKARINRGDWKTGEKIPSLSVIAQKTGVSYPTARKAVRCFEREGVISNYGSLGFFLVSPTQSALQKKNKNLFLLGQLKNNIKSVEMLKQGAITLQQMLISKEEEKITGYNVVTCETHITTVSELEEIYSSPLDLTSVVQISDSIKFRKYKKKYMRQQKLMQLAMLVMRHKKEIGI